MTVQSLAQHILAVGMLLGSICQFGAHAQGTPASSATIGSPVPMRVKMLPRHGSVVSTTVTSALAGNRPDPAKRQGGMAATPRTAVTTYPAFDPSSLKGKYAIALRVLRHNGQPASGKHYRLTAEVLRRARVVVAEGSLSQSGIVLLKDLAGGSAAAPIFHFEVDGLECAAMQFRDGPTTRTAGFRMPPCKGDAAPDLGLVDVLSSQTVRLSDFLGQVVYLDFWATWCGPCQVPMQHLEELLHAKSNEWKGKVAVLAVSIDTDTSTVLRFLADKGWTAARQLRSAGGESGWEAEAAKVYGVRSIPTGLVIDTSGTIAWRGNPNVAFDLEREVQGLVH